MVSLSPVFNNSFIVYIVFVPYYIKNSHKNNTQNPLILPGNTIFIAKKADCIFFWIHSKGRKITLKRALISEIPAVVKQFFKD